MMVAWKCSGCGKPSRDRERSCDCPTAVVSSADGKTAWKLSSGAHKTAAHCHKLIGQLFETHATKIRLSVEDVDLIKRALTDYAALPACNGKCEVETQPVSPCPDCGQLLPLLYPCLQQGCPVAELHTRPDGNTP